MLVGGQERKEGSRPDILSEADPMVRVSTVTRKWSRLKYDRPVLSATVLFTNDW